LDFYKLPDAVFPHILLSIMKNVFYFLMLVLAVTANAQWDFTAAITSGQAVPPNSSRMKGEAVFTLNPDRQLWGLASIYWGGENDLVELFSSASPGSLGTRLFTLSPQGPIGPTETEPGGWTFESQFNLTEQQVVDLYQGNWWINVSTAAFPNGEARGQVMAVPESSGLFLLALVVGVGMGIRRSYAKNF
jgi:hypothetical protein